MNTITVSVTQEHIDKGITKSCSACPVALALRALGEKYSYLVGDRYLYNIHDEIVTGLPLDTMRFIFDFDAGNHVEPFTFEVYLP